MKAEAPALSGHYTMCFWFVNAMPYDVRPVSGYLFAKGKPGATEGDQLGIGGTAGQAGRLFVSNGDTADGMLSGKTELSIKRWHFAAMAREGSRVRVYLDGNPEPEIDGPLPVAAPQGSLLFFGGGAGGQFTLEGKLDEVAVFGRALEAREIAGLYEASNMRGQNLPGV